MSKNRNGGFSETGRREFLQMSAVSAAAVAGLHGDGVSARLNAGDTTSEDLVRQLYASLSEQQRAEVCFDWDHTTPEQGLLRTHVSNNWHITPHRVVSSFYTPDQQELIEALFWSLYNPEWIPKIRRQLKDDAGGYGRGQSLALFGNPESGPFELVITGRHLTIRCDGNSTPHVAFGGPVFYGHAAGGFHEAPDHPGNVFWSQAVRANEVYNMLDGRQRRQALITNSPPEEDVHFRSGNGFPGIPVSELSSDQREKLESVLKLLVEPFRAAERQEALNCLQAQGGLERCALSFYESDDVGNDGIWDTWRLEGPSFVWHYRGDPHVHVWVNVADDPSVKITTAG